MKQIAIRAITPILISLSSIAPAQVPSDSVRIIQATYGAEDAQVDATQQVQAAIASGQTSFQVDNRFFGKDPAFGKVKTLSVVFLLGGVQHQKTAREREQISFATPNAVQPNVAPQLPLAQAPAEIDGQTRPQTLSPGAPIWLVQRVAIRIKGGIKGIEPGTAVVLVEDHGNKLLVRDSSQTFDVPRKLITTDPAVAQGSAQAVTAQQAAIAQFNAKAQQEAVANEKARAEQSARAARDLQQLFQRQAQIDQAQGHQGVVEGGQPPPRPVGDSMSRIGGGGGVGASSARFKDEITPMGNASDVILALKPVTFRYKQQFDPLRMPQFGLVAEEVEKVNPHLVTREADGKLYGVRYDAVNAMLLNEFLKEHRKVEEQGATITQLKKEIEAVVARLNEQDAEIQRKSGQEQSGLAH
jgi:endosialidase-like protein